MFWKVLTFLSSFGVCYARRFCYTTYLPIWKDSVFKWQLFWTVCQVNKEYVSINRIFKADDSKSIMSMSTLLNTR